MIKVKYDISNTFKKGEKKRYCLSISVYTETPNKHIFIGDILDELDDLIYVNEIADMRLFVYDGMFVEIEDAHIRKLLSTSDENLRVVSFGAMTPLSKLRNAKGYDAFIRWYKNKD
jgi:hypothetical protein